MLSETPFLGVGLVDFGFKATGATAAPSDPRWSRLEEGLDQLYARLGLIDTMQQRVAARFDLASKAVDQVRHTHDMLIASVVSEVAEHKLFDDMPCANDVAARAELVAFKSPEAFMGAAQEVVDEMPQMDVVWDEELLHGLDSHDDLLRQIAQGGEFVSSEDIMMGRSLPQPSPCELIPRDGNLTVLSPGPAMRPAHQMFTGMPCQMSAHQALDQMPHLDGVSADKDGEEGEATPCLQQAWVAGVASEVLDEMHRKDVVWDEDVQHNHVLYDSLLQQLALDNDSLTVELDDDAVLTHVGGSPLFLEMGMLSVGTVFEDMLEENRAEDMVAEVLHIVNPLHHRLAHVVDSQLLVEFSMAEASKGLNGVFNANIYNMRQEDQHGSRLRKLLTSMRHESIQGSEDVINLGMSVAICFTAQVFNEIPAWRCNGFSPGEIEQKNELCRETVRQWDLGILRLILSNTESVKLYNSDYICPFDPRLVGCRIEDTLLQQAVVLHLQEAQQNAMLVEVVDSETTVKLRACRRALKGLLYTLGALRKEIRVLLRLNNIIQIHDLSYANEFSDFGCYSAWWCTLRRWSSQGVHCSILALRCSIYDPSQQSSILISYMFLWCSLIDGILRCVFSKASSALKHHMVKLVWRIHYDMESATDTATYVQSSLTEVGCFVQANSNVTTYY